MSEVREIKEADFEGAVLGASGLTLVDFWRERCAPCVRLDRMLDGFAADFGGQIQVVKVDAEKNPAVAEKYDVKGAPTLLFFKDGEIVERMTGVERKATLRQAIEAHL
ncbi:MAG: thioredoxin family protein [Nitrospinota bacterium]